MKNLDSIIEAMRKIFVPRDVFELRMGPMEKLYYGIISMIVMAVFGALITLVIRQ